MLHSFIYSVIELTGIRLRKYEIYHYLWRITIPNVFTKAGTGNTSIIPNLKKMVVFFIF